MASATPLWGGWPVRVRLTGGSGGEVGAWRLRPDNGNAMTDSTQGLL